MKIAKERDPIAIKLRAEIFDCDFDAFTNEEARLNAKNIHRNQPNSGDRCAREELAASEFARRHVGVATDGDSGWFRLRPKDHHADSGPVSTRGGRVGPATL